MLHPSYTELRNAVNSEVKEGDSQSSAADIQSLLQQLSVQDRLLRVQNLLSLNYKNKKPLSVAVDELMNGDVKILSSGEDADDEDDKPSIGNDVYDIALDVDDEDIFEDEKEDSDEDAEDEEDADESETKEDMSSEEDDYE